MRVGVLEVAVSPNHRIKRTSPNRCHHLFKTFYSGPVGWTEQQLPDGTIVWTSPSGRTYTTPLLSVSREYHNSDETHSKRAWTHWDAIGPFAQVSAGLQPNPRTHLDALRRPESTSQAEYAGSIPVIDSKFMQVRCFSKAEKR